MSEGVEGYPASGGWRREGWRPWWRRVARQPVDTGLPPLGLRVGGYRLEARLGEGGQGTVYRARRGGQLYAVKFIPLFVEDWAWRELEVRLRLRRVGEVRLEGCGHWPDKSPRFLFIAMPYVHGRPVDTWARDEHPTARQMALLLREVARQLVPVHRAGVVHRDIKCANVLVRHEDGSPVLVDFGVGTYPGAPEITSPLVLPGTRHYRSPEMLRFRREWAGTRHYQASVSDDLWALGVFLYWLLTGRHPFEVDGDEGALADVILRGEPEPPHVHNPRVPRALSAVCLRMLEKAPEARYPSAEALGEALEAILAEADVAWDVALCEAYGPGETAESRQELAWEAPSPTRRMRSPLWRIGTWGGAVLALSVLGLLVAPLLPSRPAPEAPRTTSPVASVSTTPEVTNSGREVAPERKPPEGGEGAAPTKATTPAPVASATRPQDSTRVKTPQPPPAEKKPQQKTVLDTATKALTTACAVGQVAGCTGPAEQVRPAPSHMPPPMECPETTVNAMKQELGLGMGWRHGVSLVPEGAQVTTVRPGPVTIWSGIPWGKLASDNPLTGELYFGEGRVYGRFTQAHMKDGRTIPICMELYDKTRDWKRGVVMRTPPGDSVEVISDVDVRTGFYSE